MSGFESHGWEFLSPQTVGRIGEDAVKEELTKRGFTRIIRQPYCTGENCIAAGAKLSKTEEYFLREYILKGREIPYPDVKEGTPVEHFDSYRYSCFPDPQHRIATKKGECFLGERWLRFMSYVNDRRNNTRILLDFYAEKEGEQYLIEVKTGAGKLVRGQRKMFEKAKELGFKVLLFKCSILELTVGLNCEEI